MKVNKTLADVYEISLHNPVVYAALSMYSQNMGRIAMFDVLVAMVCALDEQNTALLEIAQHAVENSVVPAYIPPRSN